MNIIKRTGTHNTTAAKGRKIQYLAIHYTAGVTSKQGSAKNTADWFRNQASGGSADYIVDDVETVQYNPDPRNRYCWAVGGSKYKNTKGGRLYGTVKNSNSISIEICSTSRDGKVHPANDSHWYFTDAAVERAVELTNYLMKEYGISADRVIRHFDTNGKPCPGIIGWNEDSGDESKWRAFKSRIGGAASATVSISTNLRRGDKGEAVRAMQQMLIQCGYSCGSAGADGDFGKNTRTALMSFQRDHGLSTDGIYGPASKAALESVYRKLVVTAEFSPAESAVPASTDLQASSLKNLSNTDLIKTVGPLFTADQQSSGILASVSLAQFILESGWGKSSLTQNANNGFGMKANLSSNSWTGSTWDGKSVYLTQTKEQKSNGSVVTITAEFRKYNSLPDSIADHSAYLNGAKKGNDLRYAGLKWCTDYRKAAQIIKDGGYATALNYVDSLCSLIEKWNLTQYDVGSTTAAVQSSTAQSAEVQSSDESEKSQFPYLVRVSIKDLNIRSKPTASSKSWGYIAPGVYTIIAENNGFGLLKSYSRDRNGWIKLSYTKPLS